MNCMCNCNTPIKPSRMGTRRRYAPGHSQAMAHARYGQKRAQNANKGYSNASTPAQVTKEILNSLGRDAWTDKRETPRQSYGFTRAGVCASVYAS